MKSTNDNKVSFDFVNTDPEMKAFFNQQVHLLKPFLLQEGVCMVKVSPGSDSKMKRVSFVYVVDEHIIESNFESEDIFEATIEARQSMEHNLSKIISAMDASELHQDQNNQKLLH